MLHKGLIAIMLTVLLFAGGVLPSQARERNDKCEQRIRKAEINLEKAVRRHGEHSRQAEQRRRDVEKARAKCRFDEHRDHDRYYHDRY